METQNTSSPSPNQPSDLYSTSALWNEKWYAGTPLFKTLGTRKVRLSWSNSRRQISLHSDTKSQETIFDVSYEQVQKAVFELSQVTFKVNGKSYELLMGFKNNGIIDPRQGVNAAASLADIVVGTLNAKAAGFDELREALAASGVKTHKTHAFKIIFMTFAIGFGIIILAFIAFCVYYAMFRH